MNTLDEREEQGKIRDVFILIGDQFTGRCSREVNDIIITAIIIFIFIVKILDQNSNVQNVQRTKKKRNEHYLFAILLIYLKKLLK